MFGILKVLSVSLDLMLTMGQLEVDDLFGPFKPKLFYGSVIPLILFHWFRCLASM